MQKSLLALTLLALLASCGDDKNYKGFQLRGILTNTNGETIYLEKIGNEGPVKLDSVVVGEKGEFEFRIDNYRPKIGFYRVVASPRSIATLVLDSADKAYVTGDIKDLQGTYKVEGSAETKLYLEFGEIARKRDIRLDSLNGAFTTLIEPFKMDSLKIDSVSRTLQEPYTAIVEAANLATIEKIKQNTSMYSSMVGIQPLEPDKNADLFKLLDDALTKKFPQDMNVKMFHQMIVKMLSTNIGSPAPEIALPSPDGKEIALSSLRGKVVLIDFWASWCRPCRIEMPNVVKAYAKFKNKGFEIYGVSLDQDKDRWVEAIAKEKITWPQVSDLKQWQSEVVRLYNIRGIPHTVLLDKEGKIIAKDLRGPQLEAKLAEVLN